MKRLGIILLVLGGLAVVLFGWSVLGPGPLGFAGSGVSLALYRGENPSGAPASLASASLLARGEYLARAADCESCHTAPGGHSFAGGRAFAFPFGTLYSPNITADRASGIGGWSDAQFLRALHAGIAPDGSRYYPAFPYDAYSLMTDADALAIKAYLLSLPAVRSVPPANTLRFPFNQRWLLGAWSTLFNPGKRFEPRPDRSAQWNRGAYLSEALGHCGECHTPRNPLAGLDNRRKFAGAVAAGWTAFNITPDRHAGIGTWDDAALERYLSAGQAAGHGTACGPMGEAIDRGLQHLTPGDIAAIVVYLRSVPPRSQSAISGRVAVSRHPRPGVIREGEAIYAGSCASCHGVDGENPVMPFATIVGAHALREASARNVVQTIIWGVSRESAAQPATAAAHATFVTEAQMPAFGSGYSDAEIAAVANYVTARLGSTSSLVTAREVMQMRTEATQ